MWQEALVEHGQVHVLAQDGQGLDGGLAHAPVVVAPELQEDGEEGVLFVCARVVEGVGLGCGLDV